MAGTRGGCFFTGAVVVGRRVEVRMVVAAVFGGGVVVDDGGAIVVVVGFAFSGDFVALTEAVVDGGVGATVTGAGVTTGA